MKVLLQRVHEASVEVDGDIVGQIKRGLLLFVGIGKEDTIDNLKNMAQKLLHLRIFPDEKGRFHFSISDIKGELLLVPQFTLYADTQKGRRPEFFSAMHPDKASPLFDTFVDMFQEKDLNKIETGIFGADMKVALINDGPVTIQLEY